MSMRAGRKALSTGVIIATMLGSMLAAALAVPSAASAEGCTSGSLIKGSLPAVYYCGADGKRYVFTNHKAYFTWYADFSGITVLTDSELGAIPIGGNVTYRPGKKMIKIQSDPRVYVISRGGVLRHVPSEDCAATLYGSKWNTEIDDISDAFFVNYQVGSPLATCSDFDKSGELNVSVSVNIDKQLTNSGAIVLPSVQSVTPSAGATGVALDANVSATFSKNMRVATLDASTFKLVSSASGAAAVAGTVTVDGAGRTVTLDPSAALQANTTYRATLTTGVRGHDDTAMSADYSWTFTTGSGAAVPAAPTVTSVSPASGATGVSASADVAATFSAAMDASTVTSANFVLTKSGSGSAAVAGAVTYSGNTATFNPTAALEAGASYTATVKTGVKSAAGVSLAADYTWSFTVAAAATGAVTVTAISPPDGGTAVATSTPITATFSAAMDAATLTTSTFKLTKGSADVAGAVSYSANVVTFTPSAALEAGATYTVTITSGAKDTDGDAISGGSFTWSFTTAS